MKEIKLKNYIMATLIIMGTFIISLYILTWYKNYNKDILKKPVITNTLSIVKYNELDEVIKDREFLILYACTSSENKCRSLEKKLNNFINEKDLSDDIVYFNLGYSKDSNNYIDKIYNTYKSERLLKKINTYPTLIVFNESKIIDVLSSDKEKNITIEDIKDFLEGYDIK